MSRPFEIYDQVDALQQGMLGPDKFSYGRNYCEGACVLIYACFNTISYPLKPTP